MIRTDAELLDEPGSRGRYYQITFVDGSMHQVVPDGDHDVSALVGEAVTVYAPGRRTTIPWHRVRAVVYYGWDTPED